MFLTDEELHKMTESKQTARQIRWLIQNGFTFYTAIDGHPKVLIKHVEEKFGIKNNMTAKRIQPNEDGLKRLNGLI